MVGFFDAFQSGRQFAMDMAGFAVSVERLRQFPEATMPWHKAYMEDRFLKALQVTMDDLQPVANNCTKARFLPVPIPIRDIVLQPTFLYTLTLPFRHYIPMYTVLKWQITIGDKHTLQSTLDNLAESLDRPNQGVQTNVIIICTYSTS